MRNFKHSVIAAIAIAMISSLAAAQAADLRSTKAEREQRINATASEQSITIAEKGITDAIKGTAELTGESETTIEDIVSESEVAAKSFYPLAYIIATSEAVNIRETPSEEAAVIDQAEIGTEVEVTESSDGWYKIVYDGGKTGYVAKDFITQDSGAAEEAKMSQSNYKIAQVQLSGSSVRVRSDASTDSNILDELEDGRYVYVVEGKDDFIKVIYGSDLQEGYIINTSIEFTGEWESKDTIAQKQQEIKEAQEAARRAEEAARQNVSNAGTSSYTPQAVYNSAGSSKGEAIVNTAMQYLGVPYVWGGTSPKGFDCSGLVQYVLRQNGISVARVAADQRNCGTFVSRENLQPGDLVFFGKGSIHHVGIYVGNGNMIHAPQTGDVVKISSINSDYRISSYAGAVRVY